MGRVIHEIQLAADAALLVTFLKLKRPPSLLRWPHDHALPYASEAFNPPADLVQTW